MCACFAPPVCARAYNTAGRCNCTLLPQHKHHIEEASNIIQDCTQNLGNLPHILRANQITKTTFGFCYSAPAPQLKIILSDSCFTFTR